MTKPKGDQPAPEPAAVDGEPTMPEDTAARLFEITIGELRRLSRADLLPRILRGRMPLARTIQMFISYVREDYVNLKEAAATSGFSHVWIGTLVADGYIPRQPNGRLRRIDVFRGLLKFKNDEERRSTKNAAENRVKDARAAEIEMRVAVRRRELIPLSDAEAGFAALSGIVRETLDGFPARITRERGLRISIERETNDALRRIAETAETIGDALASGREVLEAGNAADA